MKQMRLVALYSACKSALVWCRLGCCNHLLLNLPLLVLLEDVSIVIKLQHWRRWGLDSMWDDCMRFWLNVGSVLFLRVVVVVIVVVIVAGIAVVVVFEVVVSI